MNNNTRGVGISLSTLLFVVFLVLKLTNNINWSWWLVTMPIWAPPATLLVVALLVLGIHGLHAALLTLQNKTKK